MTASPNNWIKKITAKRIVLPVFIGIAVFICLVVLLSVRNNYDTKIVQKEYPEPPAIFNLKPRLALLKKEELTTAFPWKDYLDSANLYDILSIKKDLAVLDSFSGDPGANREMLSGVLTNKYSEKISGNFKEYDPDILLKLVQWAEDYKAYAKIDPGNDIFYESIVTYWLSFVTNKLADFSKANGSIKYSFKYKYLVGRCHELKFTTPVKVSATEKVVENLTAGKWNHLTDASWNQTSRLQKIIFLLIILITCFGYYLIILKIINKWKK